MAWIADAKLAAAVSNAGGLGLISSINFGTEAVREEILDWYVSQPSFIRLICGKQLLETGLLTSADHKYGEMSTVA